MRSQFRKKRKKNVSATPSSSDVITESTTPTNTQSKHPISYEETIDWSILAANVVKDVSEATGMLSPLKSTMALLIRGLEVSRGISDNNEAWRLLREDMKVQLTQIEGWVTQLEEQDRQADPLAKAALKSYNDSLLEIKEGIDDATSRTKSGLMKAFKRIGTVKIEQEMILQLNEKMDRMFKRFSETMSIIMSRQLSDLKAQLTEMRSEFQQQFLELKASAQVNYGTVDSFLSLSYGRSLELCEPGTRRTILEGIHQWAEDISSEKLIFWLRDGAGTGKTTIAATIADKWLQARRLAGRFFFSPNSTATSVTDHFCVTLARDMAVQLPALATQIHAAIRDSPPSHFAFHQQFERLIIEPLQKFRSNVTLFLVVDAVDHCDPEGRVMLLEVLISRLPSLSNLKMLLTSQPLPDIEDVLAASPIVYGRDIQLLDIHDNNYDDIKIYVNRRLPKLTNEQREAFVLRSGGLFIWAATACRMLSRSRRPAQLLADLISAKTVTQLDELYLRALRQACVDLEAHDLMMDVLRFIIAAFQPISISTIQEFLPNNPQVDAFVQDLGGVLKDGHPDRPIFVIHPTFREFISHPDRANGFILNLPASHGALAVACMEYLSKLKCDVFQVRRRGYVAPKNEEMKADVEAAEEKLNAAMKYASSYWAHHAAIAEPDVWTRVLQFLSTKLLPWVELMSWRESISICLEGLSKLLLTSRSSSLEHPDRLKVSYAYQFVLRNQNSISEYALHTYTNLSFTPSSPLFQPYLSAYSDLFPSVIQHSFPCWNDSPTLSGHTNIARAAFSPTAMRIVSLSRDGTLCIWNTETGSVIRKIGNREAKIQNFSFSVDGGQLALAMKESVEIWDLQTGMRISSSENILNSISGVSFSPTGYIVATSRAPDEIRKWDPETGSSVGNSMTLEGDIRCHSISIDGTRLACVSEAAFGTLFIVTLFDLESYEPIAHYSMPMIRDAHCITFNTNGAKFMTWDETGTIYIRRSSDGGEINTLRAHDYGVEGALFSPQDGFMASYGSYGNELSLWNLQNGNGRRLVSGHTRPIRYASFSPNGNMIATISMDQTVRVWNVSTGSEAESLFQGYTEICRLPMLSNDWNKLMKVSISDEINVYTLPARGDEEYEEDHDILSSPSVAFSPRGDVLACGWEGYDLNPTIQLWDATAGSPVGTPMEGHDSGISSVVFSPDGQLIASGSWNGEVILWDAGSQALAGHMRGGHSGHVTRLVFTPDGKHLVSSSGDAICIWNVRSHAQIWRKRREAVWHDAIALSEDGMELAGVDITELQEIASPSNRSKNYQKVICIWDLETYTETCRPIEYQYTVGFSFHPRDKIVVSSHHFLLVIWEVEEEIVPLTEIEVGKELRWGHIQGLYDLWITESGAYLVYGHCVWDIAIPEQPRELGIDERPIDLSSASPTEHSLLTYVDGWIYSAFPKGRLVPVPEYLRERFKDWTASGNRVVAWTLSRKPVIIDCTNLVA